MFCIAFMNVPENVIVGVKEVLYLKRIENLVMLRSFEILYGKWERSRAITEVLLSPTE